jgi:hypothetical protein
MQLSLVASCQNLCSRTTAAWQRATTQWWASGCIYDVLQATQSATLQCRTLYIAYNRCRPLLVRRGPWEGSRPGTSASA